jgi:hypothetical protein
MPRLFAAVFSPSSALAVKNAFIKACIGAFFASWVPPVTAFIYVIIVGLTSISPWSWLEKLPGVIVGGLYFAAIAGTVGALGLLVIGIPVLFLLTLGRVNQPLVASVVAASFIYWRVPFNREDVSIFVLDFVTAAITGFFAARFAANLSSHRTCAKKAVRASDFRR